MLRQTKTSNQIINDCFIWNEASFFKQNNQLHHCLIKGLLSFTLCFGLIHGVLSAFSINYNIFLVAIITALVSLFLSSLHMRKWLFNIGYIFVFFLFVSVAMSVRYSLSTGYKQLIKVLNDEYGKYLDFNSTLDISETAGQNPYYNITMVAILVSIFLLLVIQSQLFYAMHFWILFFITFLPLQLCIYIEKYPSLLSMFLLIFSYISIYQIKKSNHYLFTIKKRHGKDNTFVENKKDPNKFVLSSSSQSMFQTVCFSGVVALAVAIFLFFFTTSASTDIKHTSPMKQQMDPYVEIVVKDGFMGLFDRYSNVGGMNGGQLGGVNSIRPDFKTDLLVTFSPYSNETIYLKGYTGKEYYNNRWYPDNNPDIGENFQLQLYMNAKNIPAVSAKMDIKNVDASPDFVYYPYYVAEKNDKEFPYNTVKTIHYIPYVSDYTPVLSSNIIAPKEIASVMDNLNKSIREEYTQIPEALAPVLESFHSEIGYGDSIYKQAVLIDQFFYNNYPYSYSPGKTPRGADYVEDFLVTKKEGFCAHFASAGAMLLRSYGIPARYAEGYVISNASLREDASIIDGNPEEYFSGNDAMSSDYVVSVEVPDGNAHAWVEIYVDNFGWVPYEFTPPSTESPEMSDFLSILSGLFRFGGRNASSSDEHEDLLTSTSFLQSIKFNVSISIYVVIILFVLIVASPFIINLSRTFINKQKRNNAFKNGNPIPEIGYQYKQTVMHIKKYYPNTQITYPTDLKDFLLKNLNDNTLKNCTEDMISETEKSCFSQNLPTQKAAGDIIKYYKDVRSKLRDNK